MYWVYTHMISFVDASHRCYEKLKIIQIESSNIQNLLESAQNDSWIYVQRNLINIELYFKELLYTDMILFAHVLLF